MSVSDKTNKTVVMFSGGIDSTAALWHVLNHPDQYGHIHVHHVHIHNVEGRWKVEAAAVKNILGYLRKHLSVPFTTSESVIAVPHIGKDFLYDAEISGFIGGYLASRDSTINKIIIGVTGTDFASGSGSKAAIRSKALHNAFFGDIDHSSTVKEYPLKDLSKQQAFDSLPPDLARLTWSCRKPRDVGGKYIECGKCKTCRLELRSLDRSVVQ